MRQGVSEVQNEAVPTVAVPGNLVPDMVHSHILSVRERRSINERLAAYEKIAGATANGHTLGTQDPGAIIAPGARFNKNKMNEQAKNLLKVLEDGMPPELNQKQKDILDKRQKEILDILKRDQVLETRGEIYAIKKDNRTYYEALDKAKMRPKYEKMINELKNIRRTLEPDDEFADSLDRFRQERN